MEIPRTGDTFRCTKCSLEVYVSRGYNGSESKPIFMCCGTAMKKASELEVQNA